MHLIRRTQRGAPAEPAILLIGTEHSKRIVRCACPQSEAAGVRVGMTLAHARALIAHDRVIEAEHEPQRDEAGLLRLASWAVRFAPLVSPDSPDGLLLDVSGCERLYRSEQRMLNAIGNALDRFGIGNRVCCASTIGAAWAHARYGNSERAVIESGNEKAVLANLPIAALRLEPGTIDALHEVNVDAVGQLLEISRLQLAARFPAALMRRIDQALGDVAEVIDAITPHEPIVAERVFDGAVTNIESIAIVTRELIEDIAAQLVCAERGAMRLTLTFVRLDATPIRLQCRLSMPSREVKHLWSLLRPKVEAVNMGYGIERMTLTATSSRPVPHRQHDEFNATSDASRHRASGELIDTLTQRLGPERTQRMAITESHWPERTARRTPAITTGGSPSRVATLIEADRPSLLFTSPELIDVMAVTPDGPPIWLRWRGVEHRLATALGPERIHCEWWSAGLSDSQSKWRDYYKVQNETGRWLWIFRAQHARRWFAHGEWA